MTYHILYICSVKRLFYTDFEAEWRQMHARATCVSISYFQTRKQILLASILLSVIKGRFVCLWPERGRVCLSIATGCLQALQLHRIHYLKWPFRLLH